jgi:FkbM family methyltransferase
MNKFTLLLNNLRGKESIMDVNYKGLNFKLDIKTKREIKRANEIFHEESLLEKLFDNIHDGDQVYDVGANIGVISTLLAKHKNSVNVKIASFEPEPRNFSQLKKNIVLNGLEGKVVPHQMALGKEKGSIGLFIRGYEGEGRHSILASKGSTGTVNVEVETCSAFVEKTGLVPDLIKIDVEGAEGHVLAGMEDLIKTHKKPRAIFLEIHNKGDEDRMPDGGSIDDWLTNLGYELRWEQKRRSGSNRQYSLG